MITKSDLRAQLGTWAAIAKIAGCTRQAVAQWPEKVPVGSAVRLARTGRWSLHDLRPDLFGPPGEEPT